MPLALCAQSLNDKVNFGLNNQSLDEGLQLVGRLSGFRMSYAMLSVERFQHITIEKKQRTVKTVMQLLLENTGLQYEVRGGNLLITRDKSFRLSGHIIDESNAAVPFANVVAVDSQGKILKGSISDANGYFSLSVPPAAVSLRVSFIGYETYSTNIASKSDAELPVIRLQTASNVINGVTVTAQRPTYRLHNGGIVADVEHSTLSKAGTANDVLSLLPGVGGNNGVFTVYGKGTPQIYINGRLLRDNSELARLRSSELKDVTIVRNPGAQYDAEVNAVILIRTIKKRNDYWSVNFNQVFDQAHCFNISDQLSWNYRKKGLDLFGDFFSTDWHTNQRQTCVRKVYNSDNLIENMQGRIAVHYRVINATGGANYEINDSNSIGVRYNIARMPYAKNNIPSACQYASDKGSLGDINMDHNRTSFPGGPDHSLSAYYNGALGKMHVDFDGDYLFKKSRQNQDVREVSKAFGDRNLTIRSLTTSRLWASKLMLSYPVFGGTLMGGYEHTNTHRTSDFRNEEKVLTSVVDEIKENNLASFLQYSWKWGKLEAGAGLRYEHVTSNYYVDGTKSDEQSRKYDNVYPNFSLSYDFGQVQAQLSYSMKTRRPDYDQLSSYVQYDDRFLYQQGNPTLIPTKWLDLNLDLTYKWLQLSASYVNYKHSVFTIDKYYNDDPNILVETYRNIDKLRSMYVMLTAAPVFGWWHPTYSVWTTRQFFDHSVVGLKMKMERPRYYCQLNNMFVLPQNFMLGANFIWYGGGDDATMRIKDQHQFNMTLYKGFFKDKLSFNLQASDIFKTSKIRFNMYTQHTDYYKDDYQYSQSVRLTISYKFNAVLSKYKGTGAGNEEKNRL
jgi:hypothetical protein